MPSSREALSNGGASAPSVRSEGRRRDLGDLVAGSSPLLILARALLAYIFIVEGVQKMSSYAGVAAYMQAHGVPPALLPLVILTELGCGLLVLAGLAARWAALALAGFCVLTAIFFHSGPDETIEFQKNLAIAGGFLALAAAGAGGWSLDAWRALRRGRAP